MREIIKRVNIYLLLLVLTVAVLHLGRTFLIPIVFAIMLAMLMAPLCRKFDQWGMKRVFSTLLCVLILFVALVGVGAIIGAQIAAFSKDLPKIEQKGKQLLATTQGFIEKKLNIPPEKQKEVAKDQAKGAGKMASGVVTGLLAGITSGLASIVITLVFTFLLLFSKEKYEEFFLRLYRDEDPREVKRIVSEISEVSQQYLSGRLISISIIAVLYSIGLSIIGIKNAILLGCAAAILTVIPYVGTVLGGLFPVFMALVSEDNPQSALWAVVVLFVIQTIDNYFIEPNVVGGKVNLSAIVSIISILAGGMLWGVPGMILFLPLAAILKIVCDHIPSLQPIGYVIGEPEKEDSKITKWIKEKFHRGKQKISGQR